MPRRQFVESRPISADFCADLDGDGTVGVADRSRLLACWGTADVAADLDRSGRVDGADLGMLLTQWTGDPAAGEEVRP